MNKYDTVKNTMSLKSSDNKIIKTLSKDLRFWAEIDTKKHLVINNKCEPHNQYGYINHLPTGLDDLKALQNHLSKIIKELEKHLKGYHDVDEFYRE